jgi:hypothetical protein
MIFIQLSNDATLQKIAKLLCDMKKKISILQAKTDKSNNLYNARKNCQFLPQHEEFKNL